MTRESSQCRKWEQERRDRLKNGFAQLAKVLPCYDPSVKICKLDILQKATSNIEELQDRVNKLLSDTEKNSERECTMKKLQDRVRKLLARNEQLNKLLRAAGISVPTVCGGMIKQFKTHSWSRRITPEQAKLFQKIEKKNISSNVKVAHEKKKKIKPINTTVAPKHRSIIINGNQDKGSTPKKKKVFKKTATSNCLILLSQPSVVKSNGQKCFLITNQHTKGNRRKTIQKSATTPATSSICLVPVSNTPNLLPYVSPPLGPGTLILANGNIMSILPPSHTMLSPSNFLANSPIYTFNRSPQVNNIILMDAAQKNTLQPKKGLAPLRPKCCLTRTTQVNKVPIPALTSKYANHFPLIDNKSEILKSKDNVPSENFKPDQKLIPVKEKNRPEKRKTEDNIDLKCKKSKTALANNEIIENQSTSSVPSVGLNNVLQNVQRNEEYAVVTKSALKQIDKSMENKLSDNRNGNKIINNNEKQNAQQENNKSVNILDIKDNSNKEKINPYAVTTANSVITTISLTSEISERTSKETILSVCSETEKNIADTVNVITTSTATITNTSTEFINAVNRNNNTNNISTGNTGKTNITTPINSDDMKNLDLNLSHTEFSNDIFASLQVPSGCQNPESTSPTAAFLLAFPLVSSGIKVTEVIDEDNSESQRGTPTLLQIGTMDSTKTTQSQSDAATSNLLNLDNFTFFSSKDMCGNYYNGNNTNSVKPTKLATSTSLYNISNVPTTNTNKSTYINVKGPCLPISVAENVKENVNAFNEKEINSSKTTSSLTSNIPKINMKFSYHSVPESKLDLDPKCSTKENDASNKNCIQKSQYSTPTTVSYSSAACNFTCRSDPPKICTTCTYVNINKNYSNPLYTNCNNYNYSYPDTNFNQNYYKNLSQNENKTYYPLNYDNYTDYHKNEPNLVTNRCYETPKDRKVNGAKVKLNPNRAPVNWMTTLDNRLQTSECMLTSYSKGEFNQSYPVTSFVTSSTTYFSSTSIDTNNCLMEGKKCLDVPLPSLNSHQRPSIEDKQFSWSPSKLPHFLDPPPPPPNYVNSTLPTLVGDLALGNPLTFGEQKNDFKYLKDTRRANKGTNCENQNNFLSVSQLVDHNKTDIVPAKTSSRRNSGNRSQKVKRASKHETKDMLLNCNVSSEKVGHVRPNTSNYISFENEAFLEQKNRNSHKNTSSSYSAEALIGNQVQDEAVIKKFLPPSTKSLGMPSFLAENIISYFPPVDFPQENFMSQTQSYQANNFTHNLSTSFQNNTYSTNSFIYTASTIPSTYLSTTNFDSGVHDYLQDNLNLMANTAVKDNKQYTNKIYNNKQSNKEEKNNQNSTCFSNSKKSRKKHVNDTNGLASFEFPFLSVPASNNSPILPDDFHTHTNFLPPPTPFSCKNSLYSSKQNIDISATSLLPPPSVPRNTIQHPEISPSVNSVGTSLTNFNLSTIFPEINKGHISEIYPDARIKDSHSKNHTVVPPQVTFNTEPKFSFSA